MNFNLIEDQGGLRNPICWGAIETTILQWKTPIAGATLEARLNAEGDEMELVFKAPGAIPETVTVDVSWIAYADQAERLALATRRGLNKLDDAVGRLQSPQRRLDLLDMQRSPNPGTLVHSETARNLAEPLGHGDVGELLQQTLDEEIQTDKSLTALATSAVNVESAKQ